MSKPSSKLNIVLILWISIFQPTSFATDMLFVPSQKTNTLSARTIAFNTHGANPAAGKIRFTLRCFAPWRKFGNFTDMAGMREAGRELEMVKILKTYHAFDGLPGITQPIVNTVAGAISFFAGMNSENASYHGDGRGFSTSQSDTARSTGFFDVNLNLRTAPTQNDGTSFADPSIGHFYWGVGDITERTADTQSWIDPSRQHLTGTTGSFVFTVSAKNPLVPFVAPPIDWATFLTIKKVTVGNSDYLDIQTALSGDGFPVVEVFVTDSAGKAVFLRGHQVISKRNLHKLTMTTIDYLLNGLASCGDKFTRTLDNACHNMADWFDSAAAENLPHRSVASTCSPDVEDGVSTAGMDGSTKMFYHAGITPTPTTKVGDSWVRIKLNGDQFVSAITLPDTYPPPNFSVSSLKPVSIGNHTLGTVNEKITCQVIPAKDCGRNSTGGWPNGNCRTPCIQ